jgi:hypothetical protein
MTGTLNERGQALRAELLAAIGEGIDAPWPEGRFEAIARRVFEYQVAANAPYRRFCQARGMAPEQVTGWQEIPALPTAAFKSAAISCFPVEEAGVVYRTSGTTAHATRGQHFLRDTCLYDASLHPNLAAHLFPDVASIRIAVLAFSPEEAPDSSLAHMLGAAVRRWGAPGSGYYLQGGALDLVGLERALAGAEAQREPVCLLGTAFAFVHFLDHCTAAGRSFRLPEGSRLMDTGGYKGRSRDVPRDELYREYETRLGIPPHQLVNEYGMTEMGSQFYDTVLRDRLAGRSGGRRKVPPPWVRTRVVDPETLAPLPPGQPGLLRHLDLANLDSVMAIQTDDLGVALDDGFEILGRVQGAEPRGCSLAVEELGWER